MVAGEGVGINDGAGTEMVVIALYELDSDGGVRCVGCDSFMDRRHETRREFVGPDDVDMERLHGIFLRILRHFLRR